MEGRPVFQITPELNNRKQAETAIRQHEELFHLLIETQTDYAIILLNTDGTVLSWSGAGERIQRFRTDEIIGRHFSVFYRQEDVRLGKPQKLLEEAAAKGRVDDEGWRLRKDGSKFWAHENITALRDRAGRLCGFGEIVSDVTNRKQVEGLLRNLNVTLDQRVQEGTSQRAQADRELRDSLGQLRALAGRLQSVREEERTCIAREIHDELGQSLTAMKMDLVWMTQRLPTAEKSLHLKAHSVLTLIDDTITSVRRIAFSLRPGMLDDLGLSATIEWQSQEFQARTGIECELVLSAEDLDLDEQRSTAVFRIFQETLTNVARHAAATHVVVKLKKVGQELIMMVLDNGKGFEMGVVTNAKSLGLLGMKERALILGGVFEIYSNPGNGTSVTVRFPLGSRETEDGVKQ
jgi:PAS domain S-box-containing protein